MNPPVNKPNVWEAMADVFVTRRERGTRREHVRVFRCDQCGYSRWIDTGRDLERGLCVCRPHTVPGIVPTIAMEVSNAS